MHIGHVWLGAHTHRIEYDANPNCECGCPETVNTVIFICSCQQQQWLTLHDALTLLRLDMNIKNILGGAEYSAADQGPSRNLCLSL